MLDKLVDDFVKREILMQLIFDTYKYIENSVSKKKKFPAELLPLHRYVVQISTLFGVAHYFKSEAVTSSFKDFLEGLCYVMELGLSFGYYRHSLPIGLYRRTPAGGADSEADMSSYDSFSKCFEDNVKMLREEYGMD